MLGVILSIGTFYGSTLQIKFHIQYKHSSFGIIQQAQQPYLSAIGIHSN